MHPKLDEVEQGVTPVPAISLAAPVTEDALEIAAVDFQTYRFAGKQQLQHAQEPLRT